MNAPDSDRQTIGDLTRAYCRGLDRGDPALLKTIFHDDGMVTSGTFKGPAHEFVTEICRVLKSVFNQTFHTVSSERIDIAGDTAVAESQIVAVCTMTNDDGSQSEILSGGRYLDRFERRDGTWKIAEHSFICDWNRVDATTRCDIGMPIRQDQLTSQLNALWN